MGLSQGANDVIGAIGGALLAACLLPQLIRTVRIRRAHDLSYIFLVAFAAGLVLTCVYLIERDALVAWASVVAELGLVGAMLGVKIYLDHWGPFAGETAPLSLQREVAVFWEGGAAPFPVLPFSRSHLAQHLLLDCTIPLPSSGRGGPGGASGDGSKLGLNGDTGGSIEKEGSEDLGQLEAGAEAEAEVLEEVAALLGSAMEAAGLPPSKRTMQSFASFKPRRGGRGPRQEAPPHMLYLSCPDGYITTIWHADTRTLSLDLLGCSEAAAERLHEVAHHLCTDLVQRFPGTRVAASAVGQIAVARK